MSYRMFGAHSVQAGRTGGSTSHAWALPGDEPLTVTIERATHRVTVGVIGELDLASAPQLAEVFASLCEGDRVLEIDATHISFCDCAGLSTLLVAAQRCQARGGRFVLTNPNPLVRRLIELAGLSQVLVPSSSPHRGMN